MVDGQGGRIRRIEFDGEQPESIPIRTNLEAITILLVQVVCIQKVNFWSLIYSTGSRNILEYLGHGAKGFQRWGQRFVYVSFLEKVFNFTVGLLRQQLGLFIEMRNDFSC